MGVTVVIRENADLKVKKTQVQITLTICVILTESTELLGLNFFISDIKIRIPTTQ